MSRWLRGYPISATRGTLASAKFAALRESLKGQAEFVLVPCDGLAAAIESGDAAQVQALCRRYADAAGRFGRGAGEIDTLVLGCTHYPFAEAALREWVGPEVQLVETGAPVARQARRLLAERGLLREDGGGLVAWRTSGAMPPLRAAAARWLGL